MKAYENGYPFPIGDEEKNDIPGFYFPSASWGDMTGLIPAHSENNGAIEAYNEIYQYLPEYVDTENVDN